MTLEQLFQLDPKVWPLAVMAFLRVVSVFVWLPFFGDAAVPARVRIMLALCFTFFLWPMIQNQMTVNDHMLQWSPVTLCIATLREVFFGFSVGFATRMVLYGASMGSQLVGLNMGFQTASLFSPTMGTQESALSVFKGWLVLILLLNFNVHHVFLENITKSFLSIPLAPTGQSVAVAKMALTVVESSFIIGIKLAAPILLVQILITIALGLLNRAIPQLNVLVMSFPVSFLLSMFVMVISTAAFVKVVGTAGLAREISGMQNMQKAFQPAVPSARKP